MKMWQPMTAWAGVLAALVGIGQAGRVDSQGPQFVPGTRVSVGPGSGAIVLAAMWAIFMVRILLGLG